MRYYYVWLPGANKRYEHEKPLHRRKPAALKIGMEHTQQYYIVVCGVTGPGEIFEGRYCLSHYFCCDVYVWVHHKN